MVNAGIDHFQVHVAVTDLSKYRVSILADSFLLVVFHCFQQAPDRFLPHTERGLTVAELLIIHHLPLLLRQPMEAPGYLDGGGGFG